MIDILTNLFNKLGLIIIVAVILSKVPVFKNLIAKQHLSSKQKGLLILIFGLIGILGTYFGIRINGAIANSRIVGVLAGGLLGGPVVGIGAALIASLHRWAIDIGGFTSLACAISTTVEGIIGGYAYYYIKNKTIKWPFAIFMCIILELLQMAIILLVAKPFSEALELVKIIIIPMVSVNAIGIGLFFAIIENIFTEYSRIQAGQAHLVLKIANKTLPYLRKGLNSSGIKEVAKLIYNMTDISAVAITDTEKILAHAGAGDDHHRPGEEIKTSATKATLQDGKLKILNNRIEINCNHHDCPLKSAVIVPLRVKDRIIGTLKLYKTTENSILPVEEELALGLGQLFSTQLELSKIDEQSHLLAKAELKALQAQINPHFLFNAINTIMSFCRIHPEKARDLLKHLADYYRNNLHGEDFIPLSQEINHIKAYLAIEEARFSDQLTVDINIEPTILDCYVPSLILQPLVENSIIHGLLPKEDKNGLVSIHGKRVQHEIHLTITDNGVGFDSSYIPSMISEKIKSKKIGLRNINSRLINIYGKSNGLEITTKINQGTTVQIILPCGEENCIAN